MSADRASGRTIDRATFQKLAAASLIPGVLASPDAAMALKPDSLSLTEKEYQQFISKTIAGAGAVLQALATVPDDKTLSEEQYETLVVGILTGACDTLNGLRVVIDKRDRCPPKPYQPNACPAFDDLVQKVCGFIQTFKQWEHS